MGERSDFPRRAVEEKHFHGITAGMTKVDLAADAKITTHNLYDFDAGKAVPSPETLETLAERLKFQRLPNHVGLDRVQSPAGRVIAGHPAQANRHCDSRSTGRRGELRASCFICR